tara:strand:- start:426 stop:983 length:558 start_codon:yes stop_codon:yes gene_type:complete
MKIKINQDMLNQAKVEAKKRNPHIKHHFNIKHLSGNERDMIGFLGEFAGCQIFNIDWKKNIRTNYLTIDSFDLKYNNYKVDIKTETVPYNYAQKILKRKIDDNELYGRRLINAGQVALLSKYDLVVFGLFIRSNIDYWYPIGYQSTSFIMGKYTVKRQRPDGGKYPFPGLPVKTSDLLSIDKLLN